MKKSFRKFIPGLLLLLLLGTSAWAQGRIATIDLRKVFENYWKTKQANATLKERAADMEKEHKNMLEDWKRAKDDHSTLLAAANDQAIAADERERKKKAADEKQKHIKDTEDMILQYEKQARTTLEDQRTRITENIVGEIRTLVAAKAKAAGYALVIDTAAESFNSNKTPVILYSSNENDLTDAVLTQLNATAPPDTAKPEEKKESKK